VNKYVSPRGWPNRSAGAVLAGKDRRLVLKIACPHVMAGLVPAIHVFNLPVARRGCPA
jgi:hypothetical protein